MGAGFHATMLLLLPLYFIKKIDISESKYLVMIGVAYVLVYTRISQLILNNIAHKVPMFFKYSNHPYIFKENTNIIAPGVLLNIFFIFVLIIFVNKKNYTIDVNYYLIGTMLNVLSLSIFYLIGWEYIFLLLESRESHS